MVSSIGSQATAILARPDPTQLASKLFSKLDSKGQGYIEEGDLQSAFSQVFAASSQSSSSASSDASALFKALDADSNGQLTESEFSSSVKKLAEVLESQAFGSRMGGGPQGAGGMPPPAPPEDDAGLSRDQLASQLSEIGSSDSQRSGLISRIVSNFDKADTNGDGKVSAQEAMAYDQSTQNSASTSGDTRASSRASEARLMHRLLELAKAYGVGGDDAAQASVAVSV